MTSGVTVLTRTDVGSRCEQVQTLDLMTRYVFIFFLYGSCRHAATSLLIGVKIVSYSDAPGLLTSTESGFCSDNNKKQQSLQRLHKKLTLNKKQKKKKQLTRC